MIDQEQPLKILTEGQYQLSFKYKFEAGHRLTKATAGTCMTPHGHTWYAEATFGSSAQFLDGQDMALEFTVLKKAWRIFIHETADHTYFHHYQDALLSSIREHVPCFRGLPFPGDPTTELIAALFFSKINVMNMDLQARLTNEGRQLPVPSPVMVAIQETPTNRVTLTAGPALESFLEKINAHFSGWWQVADPLARDLVAK